MRVTFLFGVTVKKFKKIKFYKIYQALSELWDVSVVLDTLKAKFCLVAVICVRTVMLIILMVNNVDFVKLPAELSA